MLYLASASPRRQELLKKLVPSFVVEPASVDERILDNLSPEEIALEESRTKAYAVFSKHPTDEVLACDTVVILEGKVLGKPKDKEDAKRMLSFESGKTQIVLTGYTYISPTREISRTVKSKVTFRELTEQEIEKYLEEQKPFDKAGSYGVQDENTPVLRIEGSFDNVMGLPTEDLAKHVFNR